MDRSLILQVGADLDRLRPGKIFLVKPSSTNRLIPGAEQKFSGVRSRRTWTIRPLAGFGGFWVQIVVEIAKNAGAGRKIDESGRWLRTFPLVLPG
jgi:hypothetical protein